jgi:hypothetical protein
MFKALLFGLVFAVSGAVAGVLIFMFQVQRGWWDGPGGGMVVFPMALVPALGCGIYGFVLARKKSRNGK